MLKAVSRLFLLSIILFLFSCAAPRVEMPVYEGVSVEDALRSKNSISAIETTFSITLEKDDTEIKGDAVLNISRNGNLTLRVYSFGFLALELISEDGIIESSPVIDRNEGTILTYGLRDCLFWWNIKDFKVYEKEGVYLLENLSRRLWIDRKTMFPIKQTVFLKDGSELNIQYGNPEKAGDIWYPSKIMIDLSEYSMTLKIKEISFVPDV
jgi:outer membrane lipoprotein-sorting protein